MMSHTDTQEVTYLNGHRVRINGKVYAMERTCRAVGEDPLGFRSCSSCGYETWADDDSVTPYCPNCGARVIE